jgi:hypothetical protein
MAGYPNKDNGYQLWTADLQLLATDAPSGHKIIVECLEIAEMLIKKNISYGDSALSPIRIFSQRTIKSKLKFVLMIRLIVLKMAQGLQEITILTI